MENKKYKVTYRSAKSDNMRYEDIYENFDNALDKFNEVKNQFETFADVKLIVEVVLCWSA